MNLSESILPGLVGINEKIDSKPEVLRRIAEIARQSAVLADVGLDTIYDELRAREEIGSTGFGNGIAIPHCRFKNISGFVVGVLTVANGVQFDSVDGEPVRIIAFIIGPESETTRHLKLLSALSLALSSKPTRTAMLSSRTPEELILAVGGSAAGTSLPEQQTRKRLFHVIVQNESVFDTLLEVFEGIDSASVTVIESRNSGSYLARLPLFASLLSDAPGSFNRIILATVRQAISNEVVRRIESVTGSLDDRDDVLVVVQDIHYAAGGLSV
jgi:mannitol/fructose-specific phosphotransferase system IIA component (Ntr-type)